MHQEILKAMSLSPSTYNCLHDGCKLQKTDPHGWLDIEDIVGNVRRYQPDEELSPQFKDLQKLTSVNYVKALNKLTRLLNQLTKAGLLEKQKALVGGHSFDLNSGEPISMAVEDIPRKRNVYRLI